MRGRLLGLVAAAVLAATLLPGPAGAAGRVEQRRGRCDDGLSRWALTVQRSDVPGMLRVRFVVHGDPLATWQVALSDNSHRMLGANRTAGPGGVIHVVRITKNRLGRDHIAASASTFGVTCLGRIAF